MENPNLPNCTRANTYSGIGDDGVLHVRVVIDDSVYDNNDVTGISADMFDVLDCWNGISSKVQVHLPGDTDVPENAVVVTFYGENFYERLEGEPLEERILTRYIYAETSWTTQYIDGEGSRPPMYGEEITGAKVILNIDSECFIYRNDDTKFEEVRATIAHEMGHVLLLKHPFESGYCPNSENGAGNYTVLSIMNQGGYTDNRYVTIAPSAHDKYFLILKWGE